MPNLRSPIPNDWQVPDTAPSGLGEAVQQVPAQQVKIVHENETLPQPGNGSLREQVWKELLPYLKVVYDDTVGQNNDQYTEKFLEACQQLVDVLPTASTGETLRAIQAIRNPLAIHTRTLRQETQDLNIELGRLEDKLSKALKMPKWSSEGLPESTKEYIDKTNAKVQRAIVVQRAAERATSKMEDLQAKFASAARDDVLDGPVVSQAEHWRQQAVLKQKKADARNRRT